MTSGLFFQGSFVRLISLFHFLFAIDRQSVPEHLALASSRSTDEEEQLLMTTLEEIKTR